MKYFLPVMLVFYLNGFACSQDTVLQINHFDSVTWLERGDKKQVLTGVYPTVDVSNKFHKVRGGESKEGVVSLHELSFSKDSLFDYLILLREPELGVYEVAIDIDQDSHFDNDSIFLLSENQRAIVDLPLYDSFVRFNFYVSRNAGNVGKLQFQPMTYYLAELVVNDTTRKFNFSKSILGTYFKCLAEDQLTGLTKIQTFTIGEPFVISGETFVCSDFDLKRRSVKFEKLQNGYFLGYRRGYFADRKEIARLTGKEISEGYQLLYFYGAWCKPCIDNLDKTIALQRLINNSDKADMTYFSAIVSPLDSASTVQIAESRGLNQPHIFEKMGATCNDTSPFTKDCSVSGLLKVMSFPTYILIGPDDRIMYRGLNKNNELLSLLESALSKEAN